MGLPFPLLPELKYVEPNSQIELGPTMLSTYEALILTATCFSLPAHSSDRHCGIGCCRSHLYLTLLPIYKEGCHVRFDVFYHVFAVHCYGFLDPNKPSTLLKHF